MTFIEALFHLSPDGGSGATEEFLLIALIVGLLSATVIRLLAGHPIHDHHIGSGWFEPSPLDR